MNCPRITICRTISPDGVAAGAPAPAVAEDVRRLPPEFPLRVPVVRPWDCRTPISFRTDRPAALFGRYAAFDGAGREVCRGFLPASRLVENRRSLAGLVDADEALKQVTSDLGRWNACAICRTRWRRIAKSAASGSPNRCGTRCRGAPRSCAGCC
jgi:hypothetical protein